ncbi:MAG: DUF1697 domain-containing protein [Micromonosporaceae bacterium]|nr:DUF1697 domain-containing protein [Micromonosporaceae bacterium]
MPRHAALLRGINVGRHKRIAMADLRALFDEIGLADVRTHLQSGNAVFSSAEATPKALETRIEDAIAGQFGMSVRCLVRSQDEIHAVIEANPLRETATDGSKFMALFLSEAPDPALVAAYDPVAFAPDQVRLGDRVVYQWCPDGLMAAPPVGGFVERHWKVAVTARNWNTVTKLGALLDA